jgi:hypothetical protein
MTNVHINERCRLNANWERSNVRQASFKFDTIWHGRKTENTCARRKEMASVVIGVKADEIAVEDTQKDLTSNRENSSQMLTALNTKTALNIQRMYSPINFRTRKRSVQEESNLDPWHAFGIR